MGTVKENERSCKKQRIALYGLAPIDRAFDFRIYERMALDSFTAIDHNDHIDIQDGESAMITEVNAVNFRQNLGEMLNQVQYRNDSIVISKDGKPVAALVDAELFARIRRMHDRFDALSKRLAEGYAGVAEEEGLAEIDALVVEERKKR